MGAPVRRFALAVHLTCSVGWIGAVIAYLALGIAATTTAEPDTVRAAWDGMEVIGWYVLVPLGLGSWVTGLIMSLGSRWGLLRHYWVLVAFTLTTLAVIVLVVHMPDVSATARTVAAASDADLDGDGGRYGGDLFHASLALVLLLVIQVLNIYKPAGLTRYGWRKNQRERLTRPPGSRTT